MNNKIQFGLKAKNPPAKSLLYKGDDDEEEEIVDYKKIINKKLVHDQKNTVNKINELTAKNILEDPNAFKYDEVYEEFSTQEKCKREENDKPKYIESIIEQSKKRKIERSILKEKVESLRRKREEGEDFQDSKKYITRAYEEKLNLDREMHGELTKDELKKSISDEGMLGFYSNLMTKNKLYSVEPKEQIKRAKESEGDKEKIVYTKDDGEEIKKVYSLYKKEYAKHIVPSEEKIKSNVVHQQNVQEEKLPNLPLDDKADEYKKRYLQRKKHREDKV